MAITYPLPLADIWDRCHFQSYNWDIMRYEGAHQYASGKQIVTRKGKPKWGGSGALRSETINSYQTLAARFGMLKGSIGSFLAYDQRRPKPLLDPGNALSGFTPQIHSIHADNDQVRIKGLPATYQISIGDMFSVPYGSGNYWLARAMTAATAVAGVTPMFYVEPDIPTGIVADQFATFYYPVCVCKIVTGSMKPVSNDAGRAEGLQFSWIQDY